MPWPKEVGPTQASRRLEISLNIIYRWRQELEQDGEEAFRGQGVMTAQDAEIDRLRREVADLKEDKEILKTCAEPVEVRPASIAWTCCQPWIPAGVHPELRREAGMIKRGRNDKNVSWNVTLLT